MPVDTRITLHKLEVFRAVVESGSVGKTAEAFHVAQPVITAHLRSLETRLGNKLFSRDGRHLKLTSEGEAVYTWAIDLYTRTKELSRYLDGLADGTSGSVSVAASMSVGSYLLPPALSELRRKWPNIEVTLNIYHSDLAIDATETGHSDFAVMIAESPPSNPGLTGEPLGLEPLILVAPPSGAPHSNEIDLAELARLDFVELPEGFLRRSLNEGHLANVGLESRRIVMELGHPEAMKRAVQNGMGVALMFYTSVADELESGRLRAVTVRGLDVTVPIYLVYRKGRNFPAAQQTVVKAISEYIERRPKPLTTR
ncbi:LysR family transcriptional regulator [Arthrobacter sp. Cr_A7]|uniref:LysR family transcriptional regulator n=1 Tax=Arthrobacter sp. Cr_A7 TaxID=3031017 RepID=UPI0023DB5542|nr:LysR family transcriptional regulator [Arthrobacter sp. Cr_A7]MDF2050478.1 LysR family transcriptional regulator [Arthrobacter sp. Cr_A7]